MNFSSKQFFPGRPVTGAPFSAQRVNEQVQIASDGTRFNNSHQQETLFRDSQGRIRTERAMVTGPNAPGDAPVLIEIQDPVANFSYTLDTQNKVVHRVAFSAPENRRPGVVGANAAATGGAGGGAPRLSSATVPASGSTRPGPEMKEEDLGQQMIEGVMAEGRRHTQTWPTGSQGNDRPFQTIFETWFSPEIRETVLNKNTDPRSGEHTMKLININRSEPSPELFVLPADYSVVDETGSFQIHWTAPRQ